MPTVTVMAASSRSTSVADSLSAEFLRRVYVAEHRSVSEVAALAGCSPSAVSLALRRHGIPARPPGGLRDDLDPAELRRLYLDEWLPFTEIGRRLGAHAETVAAHAARLGLVAEREALYALEGERACELYRDRGLTLAQVGEHLGVSRETVRRHLKRHGVPRRPRGRPFGSETGIS